MGKKVNFTKDAINKHFDNVEDLEEFMDSYAEECEHDLDFLEKMHDYLTGDKHEGLSNSEIEGFIDGQKKELEEFLRNNKGCSLEELEEFIMCQDKDAKEYIESLFSDKEEDDSEDEEEDDEEEVDLKELIKQSIREVLAENKE